MLNYTVAEASRCSVHLKYTEQAAGKGPDTWTKDPLFVFLWDKKIRSGC